MAKKKKRAAEAWRYVLESDRALDLAEQSTFVLRPLTQAERAETQDNLIRKHTQPDGSRVVVERTHRLSYDLCLSNIDTVENFPVGAPEAWPSDREGRIAYLDQLDDEAVRELGNEIYAQAFLGDDVKNSLPPRPTSISDGALADPPSTTAASVTATPG